VNAVAEEVVEAKEERVLTLNDLRLQSILHALLTCTGIGIT